MDRITTITAAFENDAYATALGFTLGKIMDYSVIVSMTVREEHLNFHGVLHGGALFSLADCAFSLASNAHGDTAMAIDTHLALTAPSRLGDTLTAAAIEITRGRSLATYRVNVTRDNDTMVGLFTGTVFIREPRSEPQTPKKSPEASA